MRLYEAEGTYTHAKVTLDRVPESIEITNMLEEVQEAMNAAQTFELDFRPFEIKTIKIGY